MGSKIYIKFRYWYFCFQFCIKSDENVYRYSSMVMLVVILFIISKFWKYLNEGGQINKLFSIILFSIKKELIVSLCEYIDKF